MILLDTPSLIWWVNRNADLSAAALGQIEAQRPGGKILISALSAWEVAEWSAQARLALRMEPSAWFALIAAIPEVRFIPLDTALALQAAALPAPAPEDFCQRILAATARQHGCPLVTSHPTLRAYPHIKTIW